MTLAVHYDINVEKRINFVGMNFKIHSNVWMLKTALKVALQIFGRKFYKNIKKSSLYSQSLLIFIHRNSVVERHPITREIGDLL